jgi:hypothetical protein
MKTRQQRKKQYLISAEKHCNGTWISANEPWFAPDAQPELMFIQNSVDAFTRLGFKPKTKKEENNLQCIGLLFAAALCDDMNFQRNRRKW